MTTLHPTPRRLRRWPAAALVVLLALGACSSGGSDEASGGSDAAASGAGGSADMESLAEPEPARRASDAIDGSAEVGERAAPALQSRAVISTAAVTLAAEDLLEVRTGIERLLGRYGGYVAAEESENDRRGRLSSARLELRVPSPRFEAMLTAFDDLATVVRRTREQVDVTTEVIDVDSRIRTQEVSLGRLRRFLDRARTLDATIRLEAEVARREADLASLRAQQEYLQDQTSLATITVHLRRADPDAPAEEPEDAGFLSGLAGGSEALLGVLTAAATVLGAVLPFAALAALLGAPLWVWLRTRRPRTVAPAPDPGS